MRVAALVPASPPGPGRETRRRHGAGGGNRGAVTAASGSPRRDRERSTGLQLGVVPLSWPAACEGEQVATSGERAGALLSVNVGMPKDVTWHGRTVHTAGGKKPVAGARVVG